MDDDDFVRFRAAHPALRDAIEKCERPDWLIRVAWEGGLDRRAVIREGADAARLLLASEWQSTVTLFWPVPRPLEAVDRWCDNETTASRIAPSERPWASAVIPGAVLGSLISTFVIARRTSGGAARLTIVVVTLLSIVVLGAIFKVLIDAPLRRRVARLDEESAYRIVLDQLGNGMAARPGLVPHTTKRTAKYLLDSVGLG